MTRMNWERKRPTNREIGEYSQMSFDRTMQIESTRPTARQKKYYRYLMIRCKEEGIDPQVVGHLMTREDYFHAIKRITKQLGIEDAKKGQFDAIDGTVGAAKPNFRCKSNKYACPGCYHRYKSKSMYPCNRCKDRSHFKEVEDGEGENQQRITD